MNQYILGFDIGGTKCAVVLGRHEDDHIRILDKHSFPTQPGPENNLKALEKGAQELLAGHRVASDAIGISCGGPLDSKRGLILAPPNLPGWDHVPVVDIFHRVFRVPVRLQNDANACALAEWRWGAGRGCSSMIFLTFGTGMGAGLILDGKLYAGASDAAGEVGHIRLAEDGPLGFGKHGSFEGFCSGGGISRFARVILKERENCAQSSILKLELETGTFSEDEAVQFKLKAGEISLHDDRAVHGSPANPSARRRAGLTIRYSGTNVKNDMSVNPNFKTYLCRGFDEFNYNPKGAPPGQCFARPFFKAVSVEEAGKEAEMVHKLATP